MCRLSSAHLEGAKLLGAHLERALLDYAHLEEAKLLGAHLERALLDYAHLEGADLSKANLEGAQLEGTFFDSATKLNYIELSNKEYGTAFLVDIHWGM